MKTREVTRGLKRHPLSAAWPDMDDNELRELREDIERNGQRRPVIVINENEVIDGWQRARACHYGESIPIKVADYPKGLKEAFEFVRSEHTRRNLTASQRAAAIVQCHEWLDEGRPENSVLVRSKPAASTKVMAEEAGVSESTIEHAKAAERAGLGDAVRSGEMSAKKAAEKARDTDRRTKDKKPSPVDKLKAELAEAKAQVAHLEQSIEDLTDEVNLKSWAEIEESEQLEVIKKLQRENATLRSQRDEFQNECNAWKREAKLLRKKVA